MNKKQTQNNVRTTLETRGSTHGDYTQDAATAMAIFEFLASFDGWSRLQPVKRHALAMISFKIARILTGDPDFKDHWHDIAGYAMLAEDRCE